MWFVNCEQCDFFKIFWRMRCTCATLVFWPEAEDKALRGRNLSAALRTLYRQVGKPKSFPPVRTPWRVENQCDKSIPGSDRPSGQTPYYCWREQALVLGVN